MAAQVWRGERKTTDKVCVSRFVCILGGNKPRSLSFMPSLTARSCFLILYRRKQWHREHPLSPQGGANGGREVEGHQDNRTLCWRCKRMHAWMLKLVRADWNTLVFVSVSVYVQHSHFLFEFLFSFKGFRDIWDNSGAEPLWAAVSTDTSQQEGHGFGSIHWLGPFYIIFWLHFHSDACLFDELMTLNCLKCLSFSVLAMWLNGDLSRV